MLEINKSKQSGQFLELPQRLDPCTQKSGCNFQTNCLSVAYCRKTSHLVAVKILAGLSHLDFLTIILSG